MHKLQGMQSSFDSQGKGLLVELFVTGESLIYVNTPKRTN